MYNVACVVHGPDGAGGELQTAAWHRRHSKAVAAIIPTELYSISPMATRIISSLMRRLWSGGNPPVS